jgi:6-O-methylguanine DNA methyltransferase, DNA binding domain
VCKKIPPGKVATYGTLAKLLSSAPRAVGQVGLSVRPSVACRSALNRQPSHPIKAGLVRRIRSNEGRGEPFPTRAGATNYFGKVAGRVGVDAGRGTARHHARAAASKRSGWRDVARNARHVAQPVSAG